MKANILLVDDEIISLDVLSRRIDREGYLVNQAESGRKALDLMKFQQFDLVILDVRMPDMDGVEVLKIIKANPTTRSTPVIMLSGDTSSKLMRKCLLLGAADYLTKPLIMELARDRIDVNLRKKSVAASTIGTDLKILIVDDHPLNIALLERLITKLGHTAITANNGKEALEKLNGDVPDLVLLDIVMPGISGIEVLTEIRKTYSPSQLPVIMVTAEDDSTMMINAVTAGANDYVTKPYDAIFLRRRIESCLATQQIVKNTDAGL